MVSRVVRFTGTVAATTRVHPVLVDSLLERLAEYDISASMGSNGTSSDNSIPEAFNSPNKWELIYSK
jgi:hypothetical protein